ncbi:MAG: hypothetical protein Q8M15_10480 [Bacteroidota bacterium]|nr:hypothetical protein [Bacteroidota bacterium]
MDIFKFPALEQLFTDGTFIDSDFIYQDRKGVRKLNQKVLFNKIRYISSSISTNYYFKDLHSLDHLEAYLNAELLKNVIGSEYNFILDLMERKGIIECIKKTQFVVGKSQTSSVYKLKINMKGATKCKIDDKYLLKRNRILKGYENEKDLSLESQLIQGYYLAFDKNRLEFHTDAWGVLQKFKRELYNKRKNTYSIEYGFHKHFKAKITMDDIIENGLNRFSFDSQGARFFTSMHSLPANLRKYILIDGVPTISIDIKNSQWQTLSNYYIDKKLHASLGNATDSERKFVLLAQSGKLYEHFIQYTKLNRSATKELMLNWLYACTGQCCTDKKLEAINDAMMIDFPEVCAFINQEKKGNEGNKIFARKIQWMEADVIKHIQYIILTEKKKDCLTVHDSFCFKRTDKELVEYVVDELKKFNYFEIEIVDNVLEFSDYQNKKLKREITYSSVDLIYTLEEISSDIEKILVQYENTLNLENNRDPIPKSDDDFHW